MAHENMWLSMLPHQIPLKQQVNKTDIDQNYKENMRKDYSTRDKQTFESYAVGGRLVNDLSEHKELKSK